MPDPFSLSPSGLMPHQVIRSIMWQMLNGLNYMHQNWVIHRDLKVWMGTNWT